MAELENNPQPLVLNESLRRNGLIRFKLEGNVVLSPMPDAQGNEEWQLNEVLTRELEAAHGNVIWQAE